MLIPEFVWLNLKSIRIYTGAFRTSSVESLHKKQMTPTPGTKMEQTGTKIPV